MPCLKESKTPPACIARAKKAFQEQAVEGEVAVAANDCTDTSPDLATHFVPGVVPATAHGYGGGLRSGIGAGRCQ
jgi:hypothetical protein